MTENHFNDAFLMNVKNCVFNDPMNCNNIKSLMYNIVLMILSPPLSEDTFFTAA